VSTLTISVQLIPNSVGHHPCKVPAGSGENELRYGIAVLLSSPSRNSPHPCLTLKGLSHGRARGLSSVVVGTEFGFFLRGVSLNNNAQHLPRSFNRSVCVQTALLRLISMLMITITVAPRRESGGVVEAKSAGKMSLDS
jgi:hypothetical protein